MADVNVAVRLDSIPGEFRSRAQLERGLATAARLGATAVELSARTQLRPNELTDTGLRQLRKLLDDLNLRVAALRFQTRRGYDQLEDLDRRVEGTKAAMRLAYRLGTTAVINQIGTVPDPAQVRQPMVESHAADGTTKHDVAAAAGPWQGADPITNRWATLHAVLDDLGRYGTHIGAFLVAETGTEPGEWLAKMLDTSEQSFIGVALNPGQLIVNRQSVAAAIAALKDRIQVVSAVDGVLDLAAGRGLSVALGQGTADFPQIFGMLEETHFRGPYIVGRSGTDNRSGEGFEGRAIQELREGIEYLRAI